MTLRDAEGPPRRPSHPQSPVQQQMCCVTCGWLCQRGRDPVERSKWPNVSRTLRFHMFAGNS